MAAIDKIYGSKNQYKDLKGFLTTHNKQHWIALYMYPEPKEYSFESPLCNFPEYIDKWLWQNCDLKFVRGRLEEVYDQKTLDYWKNHEPRHRIDPSTPSHIVKRELYEQHVRDKYDVLFVIDRGEDARAWKELGLTVLEVL